MTRPLANALRSIDVDKLVEVVLDAACERALALSIAVEVPPWGPAVSLGREKTLFLAGRAMANRAPLADDVRWLIGVTTGDNDIWRAGARSRVDAIEHALRGVDVPAEFELVLAAARARLTLDAGRTIELAPLAALAGVSLGTVRGAALSGALKAPKGARGAVVRVRAKDARAWLATRGVT